jgi:hypothetical protein
MGTEYNLLKVAVASHIALDTIDNKDGYLGGAACYCGLTCRQLDFDTVLVTKVGEDFPVHMRNLLQKKGLDIKQFEKCHTTRFELKQYGYTREVYLRAKCNPLTVNDVEHVDVDGWIVSPTNNFKIVSQICGVYLSGSSTENNIPSMIGHLEVLP